MNTPNDPALLAMARLLEAAAAYVQVKAEADRLHDSVVKLARRIVNAPLLTDEEAISAAGARARAALKNLKLEPERSEPTPAEAGGVSG